MSRLPISSNTGDSNYSLFFSPRELSLINNYNIELNEIVARTRLIYWQIEADNSETDDIYGESERKIPRNPVEIYTWIELDEPITETGAFTTDIGRRIIVHSNIYRLNEVGIVPKIGDYLEWDNQYFEIVEAVVPSFIHGFPETKLYVRMTANATRENIFSPRSEDSYSEDVEHDSNNPY